MSTGTRQVLVVDDDAALLRAIGAIFRHHGFVVELCASVPAALEILAARPFDVILTDLDLGGDSGIDLLREAQRRQVHVAAILFTGKPSTASAIEALRLSAVDYVLKPFDPRDLVARVERAAEKTASLRRVADARQRAVEIVETLEAMRGALELPGPAAALATAPTALTRDPLRGLRAEDRAALSPRELEVLGHIAEGRSPKEVASRMHLSTHTVRNHVRSIYTKLGVHSQLELVRRIAG